MHTHTCTVQASIYCTCIKTHNDTVTDLYTMTHTNFLYVHTDIKETCVSLYTLIH